jgi:hypothetical protein
MAAEEAAPAGDAPAKLLTRLAEGPRPAADPPHACDDAVDAASEDSFPASDPPSQGQLLRLGPPRRPPPARVEP